MGMQIVLVIKILYVLIATALVVDEGRIVAETFPNGRNFSRG